MPARATARDSILAPGQVNLWRIVLPRVAAGADLLTEAERARAAQMRHAPSRWRFTATRAAVRQILSGYLDRPPQTIPLVQRCPSCGAGHGRPQVSADPPALHFSVSHSGELATVAVCADGAVGVDLESGTAQLSPELVAHRFTPEEEAAVRGATEDDRSRVFLRIWTRKEAYLKATGEGLGRPMSSFAVSTGERAALLWSAGDDVGRWQISDLPLPGPAVGAVVFPAAYRLQVSDY